MERVKALTYLESDRNGLIRNPNTYKPPIPETDIRQKNQTTYFNDYALKGIIEETPSSRVFFSKSNIDLIQKTIRYQVFQEVKTIIDYQSYNALFIIMRSIYLQNADSSVLSANFSQQIRILNKLVIDYCIEEQILPELKQYTRYIQKIGNLPVPLEHSKNESIKGTKGYDLTTRNNM